VRDLPARRIAAAGTAGLGVVLAVVAFLKVGGLPGVLYAAGICLAGIVGAAAMVAGMGEPSATVEQPEVVAAPRQRQPQPRWRRKSHIIAELEVELATTAAELEEHRHALANLATQLSREAEAASQNAARLEQRIHELESERDRLTELVAEEREGFERTLDELGGGIGRHGNALAEIERELEALITR
jgi:flagellar motility protein MotE (MotC chaperone)